MISTTRFKRMYLVPENIYKNVYDDSNPLEKENLENLNSKHFDDAGDYFLDNFKKEPKHVFKTKKIDTVEKRKTKNEDSSSDDDFDDDENNDSHEKSASSKTSNNSIFGRSFDESDASTPPKPILKRPRTDNGNTPHPSDAASLHKKNSRKKIDAVYDEGSVQSKVSPGPSGFNNYYTLLTCKVCSKKYKYEKPKQTHEKNCKEKIKYQYICQVGQCSKNLTHQFKSKREFDSHNKRYHSISIPVRELNKKSTLLSPKTRGQKMSKGLNYNQSYSVLNKNR